MDVRLDGSVDVSGSEAERKYHRRTTMSPGYKAPPYKWLHESEVKEGDMTVGNYEGTTIFLAKSSNPPPPNPQ